MDFNSECNNCISSLQGKNATVRIPTPHTIYAKEKALHNAVCRM